jgi:hypothetical protein
MMDHRAAHPLKHRDALGRVSIPPNTLTGSHTWFAADGRIWQMLG